MAVLEKSAIDALVAQHESRITDEHLFALTNLRLPADQQIPRLVAGHQAHVLILDGIYAVVYVGENESSSKALRQRHIDAQRKLNPDFAAPVTLTDQLAALKEENARLIRESKKASKGKSGRVEQESSEDNPQKEDLTSE